jgi:hypothetical protein
MHNNKDCFFFFDNKKDCFGATAAQHRELIRKDLVSPVMLLSAAKLVRAPKPPTPQWPFNSTSAL